MTSPSYSVLVWSPCYRHLKSRFLVPPPSSSTTLPPPSAPLPSPPGADGELLSYRPHAVIQGAVPLLRAPEPQRPDGDGGGSCYSDQMEIDVVAGE
ncbi:unnamed protein product [Closterium sp. NIES-53]